VESYCQLTNDGDWGAEPFTAKELGAAMGSTKNNGAPGLDRVTCQMLSNAWTNFQGFLLRFCNASYLAEVFPAQFLTDLIVDLYKRGSNCHPISLTSVICKVFQEMVYNRLDRTSLARYVVATDSCFSGLSTPAVSSRRCKDTRYLRWRVTPPTPSRRYGGTG
jgi:hypothetical protein